MGNFYSKHFSVAMVTNAAAWTVGLDNPVVQLRDNGWLDGYLHFHYECPWEPNQ